MKEIKYETIRYPEQMKSSPWYSWCNSLISEYYNPKGSLIKWNTIKEWYYITIHTPIKDNKALCLLQKPNPNAPIIYRTEIYWYTKEEVVILFSWVFVVFLIILISFYFVLKKKWKK